MARSPANPSRVPNSTDTGIAGLAPWTVLQAAIRAVPALKYALGVLGLVSAIAIIKGFGIDFRVAVFGTIVMVALMITLVVFAALTKVKSPQVRYAALALMWALLALTILSAVLLFTSAFFSFPRPLGQLFGLGQVELPPTPSTSAPEPTLLMTMMEMIRDEEGPTLLRKEFPRTKQAMEEGARDVCEYLKTCHLDDPEGSVQIHFPADLVRASVSVKYEPSDRPYKLFYWTIGQTKERRHFTFDPDNQEALRRLAKKSGTIFWHAERPGYVANTREARVGRDEIIQMPFRRSTVNIAVIGEEDRDTDQAELLKKAILDCSPPLDPKDSRRRFICFGQEKLKSLSKLYEEQQAEIKAALINEAFIHYKIRVSKE
jgi:hypothetical protein